MLVCIHINWPQTDDLKKTLGVEVMFRMFEVLESTLIQSKKKKKKTK